MAYEVHDQTTSLALIVFIAIGFNFTKLQKEELINAKDPLASWNDGVSKRSDHRKIWMTFRIN